MRDHDLVQVARMVAQRARRIVAEERRVLTHCCETRSSDGAMASGKEAVCSVDHNEGEVGGAESSKDVFTLGASSSMEI